jgi:hypothetical protein
LRFHPYQWCPPKDQRIHDRVLMAISVRPVNVVNTSSPPGATARGTEPANQGPDPTGWQVETRSAHQARPVA